MPKRESFVDRHQLWPFYRRRKYCEETMETVREVWREMKEGYTADDYPNAVRSWNISTGSDAKYTLVEKSKYLEGRQRMAERGYDLGKLDAVIDFLRYGYKLPRNFKNHRLRGRMRGYKACNIDRDWSLIYTYGHGRLVLYSLDTSTRRDIFRD